jgi:putative endonuclease
MYFTYIDLSIFNPIGVEEELSMNKDSSLPKNNSKQEKFWLYILSNSKPNGPLYLGDTLCLHTRMNEHHAGVRRDYAHYHRLDRLVYFEVWNDYDKFVARLRRVRNWPRDMRLLLIESLNPEWVDLLPQFVAEHTVKADDQDLKPQEKAA